MIYCDICTSVMKHPCATTIYVFRKKCHKVASSFSHLIDSREAFHDIASLIEGTDSQIIKRSDTLGRELIYSVGGRNQEGRDQNPLIESWLFSMHLP